MVHNGRYLQLARAECNMVEEQRALNQLGNSYYQMGLIQSENSRDFLEQAFEAYETSLTVVHYLNSNTG